MRRTARVLCGRAREETFENVAGAIRTDQAGPAAALGSNGNVTLDRTRSYGLCRIYGGLVAECLGSQPLKASEAGSAGDEWRYTVGNRKNALRSTAFESPLGVSADLLMFLVLLDACKHVCEASRDAHTQKCIRLGMCDSHWPNRFRVRSTHQIQP